MWQGVFPAVTTKFDMEGGIDAGENERCYALQMEAGCDGLIVCGSLGEGPMLELDEKLELLRIARSAASGKPCLMTVAGASTGQSVRLAVAAAKAGADGLMVVPSLVYATNPAETLAALRAVAEAADLPVMIYSNPVAYRVDVTPDLLEELAGDERFVAVKESSDDIRRTTEIINRLGARYQVFTGVDNLAYEALVMGAVGWVAGLVCAFPDETVAIHRLIAAGRHGEALAIYRWFRPLLDLDVSTYLVQNIKRAEVHANGSNDRVRLPRNPLEGAMREEVDRIVLEAIATRPGLSKAA